MHDLRSDWKRWSRTERISAVTFVVVVAFLICGSSVFGALTGAWASKAVRLQGAAAVGTSGTLDYDGTR